ncbi:hypothetical protein BGZ95_011098 [Linnemannia exigua]|uniref:Uncharacterized protein n=1 Tax=Linnemannia exigua TaxID=604196 RepID=A0AAD4DAY6_9FUNG|nr:hypothetical protein BGZ95_011098 [Linnemannia exigua]
MKRAVLRIATALIPCGFFEDPLTGVDYVLKHFIHLEQGLLANLVRSSLNYARIREFGRESAPDRNVRSKKPPHSTDHDQGHVTSSKRTLDDIDFEPMPFGSPEWSGKRARMESQLLNLTSLESAACSSIVSASQFSQWPGKQQSSGLLPWSPSDHLLGMLGKFTDHAALSHTASQGPRGVQPQLSVNNLRTISIILYLWTHDTSHQEAQGSAQKAEELAGIVELIGKQYLRWVLSPGMHVTTKR